ncbi:hypothetical protein Hanom_Chr10g00888961 [Helianthus anomalus]
MNEHKCTYYRMFMNKNDRTQPLFMFVCITYQMEILVRVSSLIKQTNINELPTERFTNYSSNVRFVYSPIDWR